MQHQTRFRQLLEKFLEPDFETGEVDDNLHVDKYSALLSVDEKLEIEKAIVELPVFTEWLIQAVLTWESHNLTPATNIASFALTIAHLLSKNAIKYGELDDLQIPSKLISVLKLRRDATTTLMKISYVRLLTSLMRHQSGLKFVMGEELWRDVLGFYLSANQSTRLKREACSCLFGLIENTVDNEELFCVTFLAQIMEPLTAYHEAQLKQVAVDELPNFTPVCQSLQLVGNILELYVQSQLFQSNNFKLILMFLNAFQLEEKICYFMSNTKSFEVIFDLGKIMYLLQFLELYTITSESVATIVDSMRKIISIFNTNISRGNYESVMQFCSFGQFYWRLMAVKIPASSHMPENEPIIFTNQLLLLQLLPIYVIAMKYCASDGHVSGDEFRDNYVQSLFDMMCPYTVRLAYMWRSFLIIQPNIIEIGAKALTYVLSSRRHYTKQHALWTVQCVMYALKDYMRVIRESPEMSQFFANESHFLSLLFDVFVTFIQQFQVTTRDCVDVIEVVPITLDFLTVPGWPVKLVTKALRLVNVAFSKYMPPTLALLVDSVDSIKDSTMTSVAPLLIGKLQESSWEVRDAAAEIVETISKFSIKEFPSLQKVLMDSELPALVVKMATHDGESFVRATAIKCLQEMIQVEEIWEKALNSEDLTEKMRHILINETEGIVRVEAATFMCISYENNHFPDDILEKVYETMIHSSTTDLHWEVKVRALNFWEKVINNQLQHQGMIDGSFPSVTFSKENRKIVTLTDIEIRKRLLKILDQLSCMGCLGVLMSAIRDDCDVEVSKTAAQITDRLVDLLRKYEIGPETAIPVSPSATDHGSSSSASVSSGVSAGDDFTTIGSPATGTSLNSDLHEEILDQIVNSRDVTLLPYASSDYGSVVNYDVQVKKIVSPNEFLTFTRLDLNAIINEKKNWLNGIEDLGSLLDDMLKTYDDDVNSMDCY